MQRAATRARCATRRPLLKPVLAHDSWGRADGAVGVAPSGHTWSVSGAWAIRSTRLSPLGAGDGATCTIDLGVGNADHIVEVTYYPLGEQGGIIARRSDGSNFYFANITAAGDLSLYKRVAGAYTQIGAVTGGVPTTGVSLVALSCKGSAITASVSGVTVISVTDSSLPAGTGVGFRHGNGGGQELYAGFVARAA